MHRPQRLGHAAECRLHRAHPLRVSSLSAILGEADGFVISPNCNGRWSRPAAARRPRCGLPHKSQCRLFVAWRGRSAPSGVWHRRGRRGGRLRRGTGEQSCVIARGHQGNSSKNQARNGVVHGRPPPALARPPCRPCHASTRRQCRPERQAHLAWHQLPQSLVQQQAQQQGDLNIMRHGPPVRSCTH